jgi:methenyltetrahydromethanopterin cyclohydrolase
MGALLWANAKPVLTEIIHKGSGSVLSSRNLETAKRQTEQCSEYHVTSIAIKRGHCPFGAILEEPVLIAEESKDTVLHRGHPQCPPKS